jgi:hypothetical protein
MEDLSCAWIGRINIMTIATLLKAIYRFNAMSIKIPMSFFANRKIYSKIHMEKKDYKYQKQS